MAGRWLPGGGAERTQAKAAVVLVRRRDQAERIAAGAGGEARCMRLRERAAQERVDPLQAGGRDAPLAGTGAPAAHHAAGSGRIGDEIVVGTAVGAVAEVGEIPRQPEELELKREAERVEHVVSVGRRLIEHVEKTRKRLERALVALLLAEEPQH